jgi:hypothetical protein
MRQLVIAVALFAGSVCSHLNAQTADLTAEVPFNFRVGATSMPAGTYWIHQSGGLITVRQEGGSKIATLTLPASRPTAPSTGILEFNRYGDTYFLSKVWAPESTEGRALPKGPQEKEIARHIAVEPIQTAALKTK